MKRSLFVFCTHFTYQYDDIRGRRLKHTYKESGLNNFIILYYSRNKIVQYIF